jgi:protein-ribulosamine 3-kinase
VIPAALRAHLEEGLGAPITAPIPVAGGEINQAAAFVAGGRRWFVKWNERAPAGLFVQEARGLQRLRAVGGLSAPEPLAWSDAHEGCPAWLLLPFVAPPQGEWDRDRFGRALGEGLAAQHRAVEPRGRYGLEEDNFIGPLRQENGWSEDWPTFFRERRLQPMLRRASDQRRLRPELRAKLERVIDNLERLLPARPAASLLHGDLWSGNYLIGSQGEPVLVDPAVYYGDREVDLAFTALFGGFPASFYEAYWGAWPQEAPEGWLMRRDLYQAWPLLVHLTLFGGVYVRQLEETLRRALEALG